MRVRSVFVSFSPELYVALDRITAIRVEGDGKTRVYVDGAADFLVNAYAYEVFEKMRKAVEASEGIGKEPEITDIRIEKGLEHFSETVRMKAEEFHNRPLAVLRDEDAPGVWWVNPEPGKRYRVQVVEAAKTVYGATCTCPNGLKKARAECYHAASVLMRMKEGY